MATAKEHGLRFVSLPISSTKLMTEQQLATLRETYRDPRNYPILVHCEEGHARTGVAVVIWRVEQQGWDPARAVEEMIASGYPVRDKSVDMRNRLLHWDKSVQGAKQEAE
jgi:protein tyrosine/serine phosphatase